MLTACGGPQIPPANQGFAPHSTSASTQAAILDTALSLRGTPYVYGGCTPQQGFDCSGYVWWVYRQHGVSLPRTTSQQIGAGRALKPGQLQPADLVFFQFRHGLHVGLYAGGGDFIHSPKTGGVVRVESLRTGYWSSRLLAGRRVLE